MTRKIMALLACCFAFSICTDFYAKESNAEKEKRRQERKAKKQKKDKEKQQNGSGSSSATKGIGLSSLGSSIGGSGASGDVNVCGMGRNSTKAPYPGCTISAERLEGQRRRLAGKHWAFDNPRPTGGFEPRFDGTIQGVNGTLVPLKPEYKKGEDGHYLYRSDPKTGEDYPLLMCKNCWMKNQDGAEEMRAFKLILNFNTSHGKFTYHEFTFKPRRDGKIIFEFGFNNLGRSYPLEDPPNTPPSQRHPQIPYDNPTICWWGIAHMEVKGAKLKNTEFIADDMKAWGLNFRYTQLDFPDKRFQFVNERNVKDMIEEGHGKTKEQKDLPCSSWLKFHGRLSQVFEVEKDVVVTISFYTTALDTFDTLH